MKSTIIRLFSLALLISVASASVQAQEKPWNFEFGLGGNLNSGNINNIGFRSNAGAGRDDSIRAIYANVHFLYNEENKQTTNMGLDGSINFDYYRNIHWSPFLAIECVTNHFKGYDFKTSFLGGIKYTFLYEPKVYDYSISAALVGDYVNYHVEDPTADTLDGVKLRVSVREQIRHKIGESASINHSAFYQPALNDPSDFIFTTVTKISNNLNKIISLDFILRYDYRSVVPSGKHHHDLTTEIALKIKF